MTGVLLLLAAAIAAAPAPTIGTARLRALMPAARRSGSRRIGPPTAGTGSIVAASAAGGVGFAAMAMSGSGGLLLPAVAGVVAGATVGRMVTTSLARRRRDRVAVAQVDSVAALAAEVRAGQRPEAALEAAGPASASEALHTLWALSERSGAPVATVLDRIEEDLRARTRRRQAVATHLAGARSTAVLLAGLPAVGLALGAAMGAAPLTVLFGTTTGQLALVAGVLLDSAGVLWTARIVSAADGEG